MLKKLSARGCKCCFLCLTSVAIWVSLQNSLCVVKCILFFCRRSQKKERENTGVYKEKEYFNIMVTVLHGNREVYYLTTALVQVSVQV